MARVQDTAGADLVAAGPPRIAASEHRARVDELLRALPSERIDAAVVLGTTARPGSLVYLTGYTPTNGTAALVLSPGEADRTLVTDQPWDIAGLARRLAGTGCTAAGAASLARETSALVPRSARRVGVVGWELLTADLFLELSGRSTSVELVDLTSRLDLQRRHKSSAELELLRAAGAVASAGAEALAEHAEAGVSERDLGLAIETAMRRAGSEGLPFPLIVGSGPAQTATGVPQPGQRVLETGDLVLLDCGAIVDGYCSDLARTLAVGAAAAEQLELLEATHQLYVRCEELLAPGLDLGELHAEISDLARSLGYELTFLLGHGIGCQNWEPPPIDGSAGTVLEQGMVVTVEPGIYVEGVGGARLENMFAITSEGAEALTSGPIDLWRR